jgi:hypothetical protein
MKKIKEMAETVAAALVVAGMLAVVVAAFIVACEFFVWAVAAPIAVTYIDLEEHENARLEYRAPKETIGWWEFLLKEKKPKLPIAHAVDRVIVKPIKAFYAEKGGKLTEGEEYPRTIGGHTYLSPEEVRDDPNLWNEDGSWGGAPYDPPDFS